MSTDDETHDPEAELLYQIDFTPDGEGGDHHSFHPVYAVSSETATRLRARIAELEAKNRDGAKLAYASCEALCEMGFSTGETLGGFIDRINAMPKRIAELEAQVADEEKNHESTIIERDGLENVINKLMEAVGLTNGHDYEWSSDFGYGEAIALVEQKVAAEQQTHLATRRALAVALRNFHAGKSPLCGLTQDELIAVHAARAAVAEAGKGGVQ